MPELRRLFPYIRRYSVLLAAALLFLVLSGLLESVIVMLLAPIFNQLAPAATSTTDKFTFLEDLLGLGRGNRFLKVAMYLVLFSLVKGIFLYVAEYLMSLSGQKVVAALRQHLYDRLLIQSLAFFSVHPTGKLMSRVITDTERLQQTVSRTLTDFLRQCVLLISFLALVLYADWKLALLSFVIAPVVMWITLKLGHSVRRTSLRSQENLSEISHALQGTLSGQQIVKAFGMEGYERLRFKRLVERLVGVNLKVARVSALSSPLMEFIGYLAFVPFLLYAHYQINQGLTLGAFVVFLAALFRLYEPVRKLSRMHLHFQQAAASAERIFQLLDEPVQIRNDPDAVALAPFAAEICFRDVDFSYPGAADVPVLKGIDLTIRKGEIVALVGSSGAGKSTLVQLIPRFFDVTGGSIHIDGADIRGVTLESLRAQIAMVIQETFLFNDTIRNNIAYGREDYGLVDIQSAAQAALIHDFIEELPEGYETLLGERGHRLSGGQRQRVAIARAILKRAPILILDEATSSLDSESEQLVQRALYNLMENCTTLVIAHRLSTVRRAHRILVLEEGQVVEAGTHQELMERSGVYRRLYELQFADMVAPTT